jgi:hypothetical protein
MTATRRSFARTLVTAPAALGLLGPSALLAQTDEDPFGGQTPPNVFYSPSGRPYRAKAGAPYPVVDWFNQADANHDGKLDKAEFLADAMAFFETLDRNGDGVISPQEVAFYEQRIAPEVLGMRVVGTDYRIIEDRPRLWLVQGMLGGGGPGGANMSIDPNPVPDTGQTDRAPRAEPYDASGKGASPYGFFDEPEPVTAADLHFRGLISKADFKTLAEAHFKTLDREDVGYLSLANLPQTPVQRLLARVRHAGR